MSEQDIESICGAVVEDGESPSWFKVGVPWRKAIAIRDNDDILHALWTSGVSGEIVYDDHTVTEIKFDVENRGDHGVGWFTVFAGDVVIARLNERHVHEVYYEIPTGGAG